MDLLFSRVRSSFGFWLKNHVFPTKYFSVYIRGNAKFVNLEFKKSIYISSLKLFYMCFTIVFFNIRTSKSGSIIINLNAICDLIKGVGQLFNVKSDHKLSIYDQPNTVLESVPKFTK